MFKCILCLLSGCDKQLWPADRGSVLKLCGFHKGTDSLQLRRLLSPHPSCRSHTHTRTRTHKEPYQQTYTATATCPDTCSCMSLCRAPPSTPSSVTPLPLPTSPSAAERSPKLSLFPHQDFKICESLMQGMVLKCHV